MTATADASAPYRIEDLRALDWGLAARLVEEAAAADPQAAPPVADGSVRAAAWLRAPKPLYASVALIEEPRRIIGYAAVTTATGTPAVSRLFTAPDLPPGTDREALADALSLYALRGARAVMGAAAERREAHDTLTTPVAEPASRTKASDVLTEPLPVTYLPEQPEPSRRRENTWVGSVGLLIAGLGIVAGYAVTVTTGGPFGFLDRDPSGIPAAAESTPTPGAQPDPVEVSLAAAPLAPEPLASSAPSASPSSAPTAGPSADPGPPEPTEPPAETDGPASSLLDPLARDATDALDAATAGQTAPLTAPLRETVDALTDALDGPLGLAP